MKKLFSFILVMLMMVSILLTACGGHTDAPQETTSTYVAMGNTAPATYDTLDALNTALYNEYAAQMASEGGQTNAAPIYYIPKNLPQGVTLTNATVRDGVYINLQYGDFTYTRKFSANPAAMLSNWLTRNPGYSELAIDGQTYYYWEVNNTHEVGVISYHEFQFLTEDGIEMYVSIPGTISLKQAIQYLKLEAVTVS